MSRAARVLVFFALSPACSGGCGPEMSDPVPEDAAKRYAEAFCGALFDCGECLVRPAHVSEDSCATDVEKRYQDAFDALEDKASFNAECLDRTIKSFEQGEACGYDGTGFHDCAVVSGSAKIGDACETPLQNAAFRISTCSANLLCLDGRCHDTPILVTYERGVGEDCSVTYACEDGLRCLDGTCVEPAVDSEACVPGQCEATLHCGPDDVCTPDAELGEACDTEGSAAGCKPTKVAGAGAQAWCVDGVCAGAQPVICSSSG